MIHNPNKLYKESLTRQDRLALWLSDHMGTMVCFYIFLGIGVGSFIGVLTGNLLLGLGLGALSSYVIQLVSLPLLAIAQRLQTKHAHLRADHQHKAYLEHNKILTDIQSKLQPLQTSTTVK